MLEIIGSDAAPVELPRSGVLSIGNSGDRADLMVDGQGVAAVHCAIGKVKGGGWALKDLGSEYGTIVNGARVQSVRLKEGDQIVLGSRRLRVVGEASPKTPVASTESPPAAAPSQERAPKTAQPSAPIASAPAAPAGLPTVAGYRLEKPLGRGGMGAVFLAVQESLDRRVALKVLAPKLAADADFVKRFQAEARAAAALSHPNVVTVHDVWEDSGRHWLSMEYMEKHNLEGRLAKEGRIPYAEALEIISDAAKGLVYAEVRGIVHRDIKPANLMQDELGHTKLADLGLAMHLEAEVEDSGGGKKIFGTPHFISPEQARGERVDCRSDLYSLGATAYRLLTGRTPFEGATTRDILRGHFTEKPTPVRQLAPDVPELLETIVLRLLEKDPEDRFPSAGVLLQDIERLKAGGLAASASAPTRKGPLVAALIVAALVVVAVAALGILGGDGSDSDQDAVSAAGRSGSGNPGDADTTPQPTGAEETDYSAPQAQPEDDDSALKDLEILARDDYNEFLKDKEDMTLEVQREELLQLAEAHAGTTLSEEFVTEVKRLEARIKSRTNQARKIEGATESTLEAIRRAGAPDGQPLPLGEAVRAMLAVPIDEPLFQRSDFKQAWLGLWTDTVTGGLGAVETELDTLEEWAGEGRFDEIEVRLRELRSALDFPAMPEQLGLDQLPALGRLSPLRKRLTQRLSAVPVDRVRHTIGLEHADARALAGAIGGPKGLEPELRTLGFAGAEARLSALESALRTESAVQFVSALRTDLSSGRAALGALGREFDGWKRKRLSDPRSRGRSTQEAVGGDEDGVLMKLNNNVERVPWSAFGGRTAELNQLFHERLHREYSADELDGIAALMRLTAVVQAVGEASEMFLAGGDYNLTEDEMDTMLEGFVVAREWAARAGTSASLEPEARAADLLGRSLRAASDDSWASAVADLELLLDEFRETLIVRLLSDGRPWKTLPVYEEEPAPEPDGDEAGADEDAEGETDTPSSAPGDPDDADDHQ
jgi:serine/threonine protein kinase